MKTLKTLRQRPQLFFRLSGIRLSDFDKLLLKISSSWETHEKKRLSRLNRKRAIGAGRKYELELSEQLLACLIYYRTYTSQAFLGLVFNVSSPTICRRVKAITLILVEHFRLPERRIKLDETDKDDLLYLMVDATERPIQRPKKPSKRKENYSGKKKRHTEKYQIITDQKKRIIAVGSVQKGSKHDKKIYDESRLVKPPNTLVLGDTGYLGTNLEIPIKKQKNQLRTSEDKKYNTWHSRLRIGVEHAIGRMKKFNIFSDIDRGNQQQNLIAKNVAGLANINLSVS